MKRSWLVYAIILSSLFMPKLNFAGLGEATFIRLDDVLIGLYVLLFVRFFHRPLLAFKLDDRWILVFYGFVLMSILSAVYNAANGNVALAAGLMFSARHLEYFGYVMVGMHAWRMGIDLYKVFSWLVVYLAVLVPLQFLGMVGAQSGFSTAARAIGNTAGPFELAVIASFLFLYFAEQKGKPFRGLLMLGSFAILAATQSRITMVATLLIGGGTVLRFLWSQVKRHPLQVALVVLVLVPLSIGVVVENGVALERFRSIGEMDPEMLKDWVRLVPQVHSRADYLYYGYEGLLGGVASEDGDTSALIRFYRWALLLNYVTSSPLSMLVGVGPSFASVAVDGFFVRIFTETGAIGVFLYLAFIVSLARSRLGAASMRQLIIVMAITAGFIDIFVSSKAMFLFWFWLGYSTLGPRYCATAARSEASP